MDLQAEFIPHFPLSWAHRFSFSLESGANQDRSAAPLLAALPRLCANRNVGSIRKKNPGKSAAASGMLLTGAAGTGLAVGIGLGAFHTSSALPRQSCTLPDPPAHSHSVQSHHESPT